MSVNILPKIKDNSISYEAGVWSDKDLKTIADSIDCKVNRSAVFKANSIPDVFGLPIRFDLALSKGDPEDKIRIDAVNEWRGIIALLALSNAKGYQNLISFKRVTPGAFENNPFLRSVSFYSESMPVVFEEIGWDELCIIYLNRKPFAMVSPISVVVPAAEYAEAVQSVISDADLGIKIPWFDAEKNIFGDITAPGMLTSDETALLKCWLERLSEAIEKYTVINIIKKNDMAEYARNFNDALSGLPAHATMHYINEEAGEIPFMLNCYANPQFSFNSKTYESIDIFREKMTVYRGTDLMPGCIDAMKVANAENEFVTLPFKAEFVKEIFDGTPGEKLREFLSKIIVTKTDMWEYSVQIPGDNDDNTVKVYSGDNALIFKQEQALPSIAVWPNKIYLNSDNKIIWKKYFVYIDTSGVGSEFKATLPDVATDDTASWLCDSEGKGNDFDIIESKKAPRTIYIEDKDDEGGCVVFNEYPTVMCSNDKATIGIDFGTSSTNTYFKPESDAPTEIALHNTLSLNVKCSLFEENRLYRQFLPYQMSKSIFSSVYNRYHQPQGNRENKGNEYIPFVDGHIYYSARGENLYLDGDDFYADLKWNENNSGFDRTLSFLKQVVLQCAVFAVEKKFYNLKWLYSYPTSFKDGEINQMKRIWNSLMMYVYDELIADAEGNHTATAKTESYAAGNFFMHGGTAGDMALSKYTGFVTVDIGGASSDISLWQGKDNTKPVSQTSFKVAGRTMLTDQLRNIELLKKFYGNEQTEILGHLEHLQELSDSKVSTSIFEAEADRFISLYSDDITSSTWARVMNDNDVHTMNYKIIFNLCAIVYSAALLLKDSIDKGVFDTEKCGHSYQFVIAGNGSNALKWVYYGDKRKFAVRGLDELKRLLAGIVATTVYGNDFPDEFNCVFDLTDKPKHEAACGLVLIGSGNENEGGAGSMSLGASLKQDLAGNTKAEINEDEKTVIGITGREEVKNTILSFFEKIKAFMPKGNGNFVSNFENDCSDTNIIVTKINNALELGGSDFIDCFAKFISEFNKNNLGGGMNE